LRSPLFHIPLLFFSRSLPGLCSGYILLLSLLEPPQDITPLAYAFLGSHPFLSRFPGFLSLLASFHGMSGQCPIFDFNLSANALITSFLQPQQIVLLIFLPRHSFSFPPLGSGLRGFVIPKECSKQGLLIVFFPCLFFFHFQFGEKIETP